MSSDATVAAGERVFALRTDPCEIARRHGMTLDTWQDELARSQADRVYCLAPRQRGKTTGAVIAVLHAFLVVNTPLDAVVVSKSLPQAGEWLHRYRLLFEPFRDSRPIAAETQKSLHLACGHRLLCVPKGDSTRGYSPQILVLDEAAFHPDEDIASALPSLNATKGKLIVITSPGRRKAGWAYEAWTNGEGWHRIHVRRDSSPRFDAVAEERYRREIGEVRYRREFCAEWFEQADLTNPALVDSAAVDGMFAHVLDGDAPTADAA